MLKHSGRCVRWLVVLMKKETVSFPQPLSSDLSRAVLRNFLFQCWFTVLLSGTQFSIIVSLNLKDKNELGLEPDLSSLSRPLSLVI